MKITMHIDDALLRKVMHEHGITSKTGAVDFALREVDRRATLKRLADTNLGLTVEEILTAFDPHVVQIPHARVALSEASG